MPRELPFAQVHVQLYEIGTLQQLGPELPPEFMRFIEIRSAPRGHPVRAIQILVVLPKGTVGSLLVKGALGKLV